MRKILIKKKTLIYVRAFNYGILHFGSANFGAKYPFIQFGFRNFQV